MFERYQSGELSFEQLRKLELEIAPIEATCYEQSAVGEAFNMALKKSENALLLESSETVEQIQLTRVAAIKRAQSKPN